MGEQEELNPEIKLGTDRQMDRWADGPGDGLTDNYCDILQSLRGD